MPKEILFFPDKNFSFKNNFFRLMNLLITSHSSSLLEAITTLGINHLQIISSFFAKQIKVFEPDKYKSDYVLYTIESILRFKDLFIHNYFGIQILNLVILILLVIFALYFFLKIYQINLYYYKFTICILNFFIKIFVFYLYNICLDISFSQMCFGKKDYNPNFEEEIQCFGNNKFMIIIPILTIILSVFIHQIIRLLYYENFFISVFFFAKLNSYYDILMDINFLINSILLAQASFLNRKFFLYYNLIFSIFIFYYYMQNYIYYNTYINLSTGIFHLIYAWTSVFCLIGTYINFEEKGLVYIITCIIAGFIFYHLKKNLRKKMFFEISITKISNINYLLIYMKTLTELLLNFDKKGDNEVNAFVYGILNQIMKESPNKICTDLMNEEIYIPLTDTWRNMKKENVKDEAFIKYFIIIIYNYFLISKNFCPEIYLNLSHYYLTIIGNHCEAMYYCQKLFEYNLDIQQQFTFYRLQELINSSLTKLHKASTDKNVSLENINISSYYEYENLSENLVEEINEDIELSLKFWKMFREMYKNQDYKISFNEVFDLTEKIQKKKKYVNKIWNDLMNVYNGINDYFELYSEYVVQINDDDIKKRELESFKKKAINLEDDLTNNFYSILFNKDTGIIIVAKDKGTEGIIKHWNKRIEKIFKYSENELKDKNINILMPRNIEQKHLMFMENYFRTGYKKYVGTKDFKTFAKDKNNSIIQIRLAIKLLPVLNHHVIFVGLIIKENVNDIIYVDENFYIQGMCAKLNNNLNINNNSLFQLNDIPFYLVCKNFINFYKMFLKGKNKENIDEMQIKEVFKKKTNSTENKNEKDNASSKRKREKKEEIIKKEDDLINKQVQENLEINENFELEFEIKFPQFIINYSNKTKFNKKPRNVKKEELSEDDDEEMNDEDNELLLSNMSKRKGRNKNTISKTKMRTPTPNAPTFAESNTFALNFTLFNLPQETQEKVYLSKSEEEKIFFERIERIINLFREEKYDDLELLINLYNKESKFKEYKFNFTFDNYKFGENNISYIIRCIDMKNNEAQSEEKSFELDQNMIIYKKNKEQSIKPLYEITQEEREEAISSPEKFFKLLENPSFKEMLNKYKEEINKMSKIKGHPDDHIIGSDNSSQSLSHSGFDNDLMIKNKISEIRSNLYKDSQNYYTIKYIRLVVTCISITTFIFCLIFCFGIIEIFKSLKDVCLMDLKLFKASLKTFDLIGVLISLKALVLIKNGTTDFEYNIQITKDIVNNDDFYNLIMRLAGQLYNDLNIEYGNLNMFISKYISEEKVIEIYWDHINISYLNELYVRNNKIGEESFPSAIDQFLFNTKLFLKKYNYSNVNNNISLEKEEEKDYFNYITFLLIENSYINIIPNLFIKIEKIPENYSLYNNSQKIYIYLIIFIYLAFQTIIFVSYIALIRITNSSMSQILKKLTKIKLEKIEETIKKIQKFFSHLKNFREMIGLNFEEEDDEELKEIKEIKESKGIRTKRRNGLVQRHSVHFNDAKKGDITFLSNSGFNSDIKKYSPLTKSTHFFIHSVIFSILLFAFIIPIYIYSIQSINTINKILLIINFIYGKLMNTSLNIVELKCFIIECQKGNHSLSYSYLGNNDKIQIFVKGIRNFKNIEDFYDNKFMLNACEAAINKEKEIERYNECINDNIINSANNTDNIMQLISNFRDNIYRKDSLQNGRMRQMMFNSSLYKDIEYLFFNYIYTVEDIFENTVISSLNDYIKINKFFLIILAAIYSVTMIIYNIIYIIILTPQLVHLINISRGILKIIPSAVIMNTPELQNLIGNKYTKY